MLNTANLEVIDLSKDEDEDDEDVGPVSASAPRPQHPPSRPPSYFTTNEDNKMPLEQMQDHLDQQYVVYLIFFFFAPCSLPRYLHRVVC